jgi:hypothetical protein
MRAGILDEFKSGLERLSEEDETEDSIRLCYDNRGWGDPDKFAA